MFLQIFGFCIGILYLWWEYQANPKVWIASIVMPCISMFIYWSKGLYADFGINIYYLLIAVYGFMMWTAGDKKKKENKKTLPITHPSYKVWMGAGVSFLILWYVIWLILTRFTDSNVPVADSFTTALSIVGLWMMARKYAEQWLIWLVVDIVCFVLYFYKAIPFYGVLYGVYSVIAIFGYRKWLRIMHTESHEDKDMHAATPD